MEQKVSPLLSWGEGKCTIPTFQQVLQSLLLSHGGDICPQSHWPDREAGSMHTSQIIEDTGLCGDVDSGAAQRSRKGNWRWEDTWEDPLAQLALQRRVSMTEHQLTWQMFSGCWKHLSSPAHMLDRDSHGADLFASQALVGVFFLMGGSHLYKKRHFFPLHIINIVWKEDFWGSSGDFYPGPAQPWHCGHKIYM